MTQLPKGTGAVMQSRHEAIDSLDLFPTPPWATRGFVERMFGKQCFKEQVVWEPAAGFDHMADVLEEYFAVVHRSDVFDYGRGHAIGSFVGEGMDVAPVPGGGCDWIMTNPPFNEALGFVKRGLKVAREGVAMLLRSNWVGSEERYRELFKPNPPQLIAQYVERVPMYKGHWQPDGSTATEYAWFVWWTQSMPNAGTNFTWIGPGCRSEFSRGDDIRRFAERGYFDLEPLPLFDGAAP